MLNEFRQDLVSGEWVLFASGRGKRSAPKIRQILYQSPADCPFEDPFADGQELVWAYPDKQNWRAVILKNKFPSLTAGKCEPESSAGPFKTHAATGEHELIIYKNHEKGFDEFSKEEMVDAIRIYKKRFKELSEMSECVRYISIFHNHGLEAGASVYHPHSQIISMPILPPDVFRSISGSYHYYSMHQRRVYDVILEWEASEGKRVICENEKFIAFCPFVSRYPYEVRVFSKEGHAHFDQMPDDVDLYFVDIIHNVLHRLNVVLGRPAFNFFIHTAPIGDNTMFGTNMHEFYHWHMEIVPHTKTDAGFEIGTGIAINIGDPDEAAQALRDVKI